MHKNQKSEDDKGTNVSISYDKQSATIKINSKTPTGFAGEAITCENTTTVGDAMPLPYPDCARKITVTSHPVEQDNRMQNSPQSDRANESLSSSNEKYSEYYKASRNLIGDVSTPFASTKSTPNITTGVAGEATTYENTRVSKAYPLPYIDARMIAGSASHPVEQDKRTQNTPQSNRENKGSSGFEIYPNYYKACKNFIGNLKPFGSIKSCPKTQTGVSGETAACENTTIAGDAMPLPYTDGARKIAGSPSHGKEHDKRMLNTLHSDRANESGESEDMKHLLQTSPTAEKAPGISSITKPLSDLNLQSSESSDIIKLAKSVTNEQNESIEVNSDSDSSGEAMDLETFEKEMLSSSTNCDYELIKDYSSSGGDMNLEKDLETNTSKTNDTNECNKHYSSNLEYSFKNIQKKEYASSGKDQSQNDRGLERITISSTSDGNDKNKVASDNDRHLKDSSVVGRSDVSPNDASGSDHTIRLWSDSDSIHFVEDHFA